MWNHRLATAFARANLGAPIDARAMQRPELPNIRGCPIYVHDALTLVRLSLHPRYLHCAWRHHQHAMQHWASLIVLRLMQQEQEQQLPDVVAALSTLLCEIFEGN